MVDYCVEMWQNLFGCRSWPGLKHGSDWDWTIVVVFILSTCKVAFNITILGIFYHSVLWSTKSRVFNRNSNKCCSSFWGQMYKILPFVKTLLTAKRKHIWLSALKRKIWIQFRSGTKSLWITWSSNQLKCENERKNKQQNYKQVILHQHNFP